MIDPASLAEYRRILAVGTARPWEAYDAPCCPDMGGVSGPTSKVCAHQIGRYGHPMSAVDALLVATAVNAFAPLLDECERLRGLLSEACDNWRAWMTAEGSGPQPQRDRLDEIEASFASKDLP